MTQLLFIGMFGPTELMVILMLAILLFGAQKLPRLARASGQAMGEFQRGRDQVEHEIREATRLETDADGAADEADATSGTEPATA